MWGAGVEIPMGNGHYLDLGIRYSLGMHKLLENTESGANFLSDSDETIRNGSLNLQLGLTFPLIRQK